MVHIFNPRALKEEDHRKFKANLEVLEQPELQSEIPVS